MIATGTSLLVANPPDSSWSESSEQKIDTGQYKHPLRLTELANGDLYLTRYGGNSQYNQDTAAVSRLIKGGKQWSYPAPIARNPFQSMNPVVWQSANRRVWFFFVHFGATWPSAFHVSLEEGAMIRRRPIPTPEGHYILPIYHETDSNTKKTSPNAPPMFLRYDPQQKQRTRSNKPYSRLGNLQPSAIELSPGHHLAFCRRGGGYEPGNDGFVAQTKSHNDGRTRPQSQGEETPFPNPNAAIERIKLKSRNLLFIFNDRVIDRTPLTAAVSKDQGKTFRVNLREGPHSFAYPTPIQTQDDNIHICYTTDKRTTTSRSAMTEAASLIPSSR